MAFLSDLFAATFLATFLFVAFFAAFTFRARAARAFTRFCASLARASGDMGRRFFATFLTDFFAAVLVAFDIGRPTAGRTSAISTPAPKRSDATMAAWYGLSAATISTVVRRR